MSVIKWFSSALFAVLFAFLTSIPSVLAAEIEIQNANYVSDRQKLIVTGKLTGFESDVAVQLKSLSTGSLLGTQVAEKQFVFQVSLITPSEVPCEILVMAADTSATAVVRHGPGVCPRYEYTLKGIVADEPIPYATISVQLDGLIYTTTADESGIYELPIVTANLNQLVKIEAAATDTATGETIEFVNLAGTFSRLLEETPGENVTNVTTANYVLLIEANGGSEPETVDELREAETSVDATRLFELAALIKLIVDNPAYSLPEGESSLIDFIADSEKVEAYMATVIQEDLDAALAEILTDSDLVPGFVVDDIPERYYSIPATNPGYLAGQGDALEFDTDGTGTLLSIGFNGRTVNQVFSWSVGADGRLEIVLDPPDQLVAYEFIELVSILTEEERSILEQHGISQIEVIFSTEQYIYTRITDGTLVDTVHRERIESRIYPPIPLGDGTYLTLENSVFRWSSARNDTLRSSSDIDYIPFTDSCSDPETGVCAVAAWGGVFHHSESPGLDCAAIPLPATVYGDIAILDSDKHAATMLGGEEASWSVTAEGKLVIEYADGWRQTLEILDARDIEYGIFSEFDNGTERFGAYKVFSRADALPVITETDLPTAAGRFFHGGINSWLPGALDETGAPVFWNRFGWEFFEDFSGTNRNGQYTCPDSDEPMLVIYNTGWSLSSGEVITIDRFPTRHYPGYAERYWIPAASTTRDGDRVLYVLEWEMWDIEYGDPTQKCVNIVPRIDIMREIDQFNDYGCFVTY